MTRTHRTTRTLSLVLVFAALVGAGCSSPAVPPGFGVWPADPGQIRVTNLGTRSARISAVSDRGGELALGTVAPGETKEFAVDPSRLGGFHLLAGPLVRLPGGRRHTSERIAVAAGWDVDWELRASPEFAETRFSTLRTVRVCVRSSRC